MPNTEEIRDMLSAYLDGELTQGEAQKVRIHLEDNAESRQMFEEMKKIQELTRDISFVDPEVEKTDAVREQVSVQAPRRAGWGFLVSGAIAWVAWAVYLFVTDPEVPAAVKLITGAIWIGLGLLLFSVARQRWLELPHDRYRRVKR